MNNSKKIYFVSDVHLGIQLNFQSRDKHDSVFISWLDFVATDAEKIFLLGDIFDFWFEHRNNIPNHYGRVLAKLRELTDKGIEIHFFKGNHDMWTFGYLESNIGLIIHKNPLQMELNNKTVVMGHGHNLKVNDTLKYKFMSYVFENELIYKLSTLIIHPDLMLWMGRKWSRSSRNSKNITHTFRGEDEFVTQYCNQYPNNNVDYFVFGHLHCPTEYCIKDTNAKLYILGEWISNPVYGVLSSNGDFELVEY